MNRPYLFKDEKNNVIEFFSKEIDFITVTIYDKNEINQLKDKVVKNELIELDENEKKEFKSKKSSQLAKFHNSK